MTTSLFFIPSKVFFPCVNRSPKSPQHKARKINEYTAKINNKWWWRICYIVQYFDTPNQAIRSSSHPWTAQHLPSPALWKGFRLLPFHPTFLLKVAVPVTSLHKWTCAQFSVSKVHSYLLSEWTMALQELIHIHFCCHSFYKGINFQ